MQFVGVLVGRGDQLAAVIEDERGARAPDLELGQETGEPRILYHDRKNALALLVNVDRSRKRNRWTRADRMVSHSEPLRAFRVHAGAEPVLVDHAEITRLEAAGVELDIA